VRPREGFIAALRERANRRKRVSIEIVWDAFRASVRGFTGDAEARPHLAALLAELEKDGALSLPNTKRRWDRSVAPALPHWVELAIPTDAGDPSRTNDHRSIAWPAEMVFVSDLRTVSNLDELLSIRSFLAEGGAERPAVPIRERSVELFGDEKRLDALVKGSLFRPGRLTLDLLRCREVAPPLTFQAADGSPGATALILENLHTYDSFRRYNQLARAYRVVAYGHGSEFHATVADVPRLCDELDVTDVEYFGDLDERGLAIAVSANAWLTARGRRLQPARRWYKELLDRAEEVGLPGPRIQLERHLIAWLPDELRDRTLKLVTGGCRAPQELIGWERLLELMPRRRPDASDPA